MKNLNRIILITIFALIFNLQATEIYPEWFLFPTKYPGFQIGYTYNSMPALFDASNMHYAFQECVVVGTLELYEDESTDELMKNSNYFYYFSPDSVEHLRERLSPVDRFDVSAFSQDQVYLYTVDDSVRVDAPRIDSRTLPVPNWIETNFSEDNEYYYGIGMYTAIGNENDAWKTAEEQGIFAILTALAVEVHKIQIIAKENESEVGRETLDEISFLKLKYLLKNIEVVERYPDRNNKLFYALVRIPKNGIKSPMLN